MATTKEKFQTIHVKLPVEIVERLMRIAAKEARALNQVVRLAATEVADRGYTDVVVTKGKI